MVIADGRQAMAAPMKWETTSKHSGIWIGRVRAVLTLGIALLAMCGCASTHVTTELGSPIDDQAVSQIVIGKTTRSEVFKLLGTPHSIFEGQAEFQEGYATYMMGEYYSYLENRHLSGINDRQYAILYRFRKTATNSSTKVGVVVNWKNVATTIKTDELLIFVDKETDIVADVAYRPETAVPKR
jgi:hypothetical protein